MWEYNKNDGYRIFTLEKSFGDVYMFCEIMQNSRGSIGVVENDYDAFVAAVKKQ